MPLAICMTEYGPPTVLRAERVSAPALLPGEVLIEVVASAVNRSDVEIRCGNWPILKPQPFPYTPGLETVGRIAAKAADVELPIGAAVITMMQKMGGVHAHRPGGYQSHVVAPANVLARIPDGLDLKQLAALGLAAVTAYHGLHHLHIRAGDRILIQGASGGVGSAAVGLAKAWGAWVIAITSRTRKVAALEALGADEVWDLEAQSWEAYKTHPVDGVLEMVGGDAFRRSVEVLRPGGRLCAVGAISGGEATISVWDLLEGIHLTGWSSEKLDRAQLQEAVDRMGLLLSAGRLKPPPYREYPLAEAARAHEDMEQNTYTGRLLLVPSDADRA